MLRVKARFASILLPLVGVAVPYADRVVEFYKQQHRNRMGCVGQIRELNKGTFGFVTLALDRETGQQVAIKFIERGEKVGGPVLSVSASVTRYAWQDLLRVQLPLNICWFYGLCIAHHNTTELTGWLSIM